MTVIVRAGKRPSLRIIIQIKIHSSCEIEYFVEGHLCNYIGETSSRGSRYESSTSSACAAPAPAPAGTLLAGIGPERAIRQTVGDGLAHMGIPAVGGIVQDSEAGQPATTALSS